MNNLDKQYQELLKTILTYGVQKGDRTGTGTKSIFGYTIRHNMQEGFPLLTTKKMAWKTMVTELIWFLRGDTNIKFLVDNGCHIWDGDALKNFNNHIDQENAKSILEDPLAMYQPKARWSQEEFINKIKTDDEFAMKWGELGPVYGKQWKSWSKFSGQIYTKQVRETPNDGGFSQTRNINWIEGGEVVYIDQIQNLINDLKTNPDSRRLMVNSWNCSDLDQMVLPPCHYGFQCYTVEMSEIERKIWWTKSLEKSFYYAEDLTNSELDTLNIPKRKLSLKWSQRSVDSLLGLPFNIASYGLLLTLLAKEVNMVPDQLIGDLGDTHLYSNHIQQAKEQLTRDSFPLPTIRLECGISDISLDKIHLENYQSHSKIKAPLSN